MPSKLSVHLSAYPSNAFDILERMQPSVVKVFNQSSEMNIDAIRACCPNAIVVYRQYTDQDYHGSADAFFTEIQDTFNKLRGRSILWEGIGEPVVNSIDDAKALNAWYVRFAQIMHARGERVVGFSWSTGNPTPDKLPPIVPYLIEAAAAVDVHAFHEYYSTWGGTKDWGGYRAFEKALPAYARKPVVITEAGLDDNGDPNTGGYRGKKSAQEYLEILKQYDAVLMQDPYVLGATVFQWGDGGWPSFELNPMIDLLSNYVASVGGGAVIPTPWPIPDFGTPISYSFSVIPASIVVGQNATLKWDVEGAREVNLDGARVPGHGSRIVAPTQTMTFTLRIVFPDGSTKELTAMVTVTTQPADPTHPPTVTLTAENIARLKTFPRPAQDNGRGLHFNIDLRDESIRRTVQQLLSINARWTMIYAQDELQAKRAAKGCWDAGIIPIVRIGKKVDEPFDPVVYVNALKSIGAPPYVQIYNEPGDDREWKRWPGGANWIGIFAQRWAQMAAAVFDAGGYPGLQVLGKEEFDAAVDSVRAIGRTDIWQRAFFALHNYGANHPPAYPYDPRNQQDHPGATIFDDDVGVLVFLEYARWMQDRIGSVLPIIGGEGGWEFGADEDRRYPKAEQPYHAQYHAEMFDWFRTGVISNGEPLPDYLFSVAPWITGGWGADDWWGGPLGDKTETINAVKAIPPFVRKFSWDSGTPPPPPPPTYSFTVNPMTIQAGQSATLQWSVTGARSVALDGQAVANQGTQVVTPTQTTTYVLHIVFNDGSAKDLGATITVTAAPPPPPPPGLEWDPRLDDLGVKLTRSDAAQPWRLISAKYQSPDESGGKHHVYFKALNADGSPKAGLKFVIDWVGRDPSDAPARVTTDANGEANCPLWAAMDPVKKNGIYFTFTKDAPSDTVRGMGLPNGRYVNFILTFKYG